VEEGLYSHYDLLPTLAETLGLALPDSAKLPGESFAPILRGEGLPGRQDVIVFEEYGPTRMVRDGAWKYIHRVPYGPHELYHLAGDPGEEHNLAGDPASRPIVERLKARLDAFFVQYGDPARDGTHEPVRGTGQLRLAGPAGEGQAAHFGPPPYIDANGHPREDGYQPPPI
jgi:arylsulfatase A-like enzyme